MKGNAVVTNTPSKEYSITLCQMFIAVIMHFAVVMNFAVIKSVIIKRDHCMFFR